MARGILLIAGLTMLSAVGQGQTANQSSTTAPVAAPFGGPMLVTPSIGFPNPAPTAGISDAGRAGISNTTSGIETTYAPSTPATIVTTPSASLSEATTPPAAPLPESTNQTRTNDLGASTFVGGSSDEIAPGTTSLAEVSSRYKAEKATRNARVLGNDDVQSMLSNKSGVTMAKNMPPLGSGALEQGAPPQTAGNQAEPTAAGQMGQQNAPNTATASSSPKPATPEIGAENSTTPPINPNQQSNDAQGGHRLPATATFLPLLGLLGLVSGGIGFWFRRSRN